MKKIIFTIILTLIFSLGCGKLVFALPQGQTVESGSATFEQINANTLNITASNQTVINFNSFNIAQNEIVNFIQPSNDASVLSRVIGNAASQIFGSLYANGMLVLVNPNGIHFGPNANVQVNRFIASTLNITTNNFINGNYIFEHNANSPYSQILNEGNLATNTVALIGSAVNNIGIITAYAGTAHLASGDKATVSFDQMGLIQVEINQATSGQVCDSNGVSLEEAVANSGTIAAAQVFMTVKTAKNIFKQAVNQTGVVRANQVIKVGDAIRIVATGADVVASGTLDAGANGTILISSDESIKVNAKLNITGVATLAANKDIEVNADIAADSGDLSLLADYDLDGVGAFNQAAGTTISTTTFGDITIQSSGVSTLANINSIGDLNLNQAGAVAIYNQQADSQVRTAGSLYIGKGVTLNAANTEYSISRNWANSGLFNAGTSTVNLVSSQDANVLGANIFYNFNVTEPGKIVRFDTENPQAILNNLNLKGNYGNLLTLTSIDPSKQWSLNAQGQSDIQYALVSNLLNIRAPPLKIIHSSSLGNNTNLDLDPFWTGNGATNNWSDANNWDTGTTPTEYDIVTFDGVTGNNPNKDSIVDAAFQGTVDDLNINGYIGTLTLARDLALRGNLNHQTGTFDAATYTVSFIDASKASIISGNNTFYNLVCVTPGKVLRFEAGKTQTILNDFTVTGARGNVVRLVSTVEGSQWLVNAVDQSKVSLSYIYVQDANNVAAYLMPMTLSQKGVNNTNWDSAFLWTGAIDGDLGKLGNYTDASGDPIFSLPGAGDILTINSGLTHYPSSGTSAAETVVNNGSIIGGTFSGAVTNNGSISGGVFTGELTLLGGSISAADILDVQNLTIGASFTFDQWAYFGEYLLIGNRPSVVNALVSNAGTIEGGIFSNAVTNSGTINQGTFFGLVTNSGTIGGGTFYRTVLGAGAFSGIDKHLIPVFNGGDLDVRGNWAVDGGAYTAELLPSTGEEAAIIGTSNAGTSAANLDNYGLIAGGTFSGTITNQGVIGGGTFTSAGAVINNALIGEGIFNALVTNNFYVFGGTFNAEFTNTEEIGGIMGGTFNGVVTNNWAIVSGTFSATSTVTNNFFIAGGVFNGPVINNVYIMQGIFNNTVSSANVIIGGAFNGVVTNSGTIMDGGFFDIVINSGSISGGYFYLENLALELPAGSDKHTVPVCNGGDLNVLANWSVNGSPAAALPIGGQEAAISGIVTGGTTAANIDNFGTINDGTFSGIVYNHGVIADGTFSGTVDYCASFDQDVAEITFNNLILSNGKGEPKKYIYSGTVVNGDFSINSPYTHVIIEEGFSLSVGKFLLDGVEQVLGTWGSTASGATHVDDTNFSASDEDGLGILNVLPRPQITSVTASQSINYGDVINLSGIVSAAGPIYPVAGEFVVVAINGVSQNAAISGTEGAFSVEFLTSTIPYSASTYTITYTYTSNNTTLASALNETSTTLTVNKKPVTVTADAQTKVYGAADPALTYTATALIGSDVYTGALARAAGTNVGDYAINQGTLTASTNYDITFVGANLTISAKPVTVTANTQTKVYGAVDPELTYTATALIGSDTYTGLLARAAGTNVGDYAINQGTLTAGSNYTITFVPANLTISAKPVTVTANAGQSKVYGAADPVFTYTADALVGSDTYTGALSRAAGTDVGSYAINQGTLTAGTNYAITFVSANFTIAPKAVTVTADAQTKVYGAMDPIFTYTPSEAISFTGALARAAGETVAVGPYAINQGTLSAGSNYSINFIGANLTITTKPLTITADNATKTFGDNLIFRGTEFTSNGLINSDLISSVTLTSSGAAASAGVNQSPYSIVASAAEGTGLSNYAITYQSGSLAINQSLTIMQSESVLYVNNLPTPLNISVPVFMFAGVTPTVPVTMAIPVSVPLIIPVGATPVFVNPAILPPTMPVIADVSNLSYSNQNFISNQNSEIANRLMFPHGSGIVSPGGMGVIPLGAEKPLVKPNLQQDKKSTDQEVFN